MLSALRVLLGVLGVSAIFIAASILFLGAEETARAGEAGFAGLTGWRGPVGEAWPATMDNELRFYAALWGAYGVLLIMVSTDLAAHIEWPPWLATVLFAGGVGRAISYVAVGPPHPFFTALMGIELLLPPVIVLLWQRARRRLSPAP
ncbi:MAG TPA: DUF4345 domain-containing protein [Caulobacteraceae bacterium]|nr:DUF4345 domain-containing protein [Caulobacteraceae bacterium]